MEPIVHPQYNVAERPQRYRCGQIHATAFGKGGRLVYRQQNRCAALFGRPVLDVLSRLNSFRTIEEHADSLWAEFQASGSESPFASADDLRYEITSAAEEGLLISLSEMHERCGKGTAEELTPKVVSTYVHTSDRPQQLERAVRSLAANFRAFGRDAEIVVLDESRDPSNAEKNRTVLKRVCQLDGVEIRYSGASEKERFTTCLVKETDIPPHLMDFALAGQVNCNYTCGPNCNALLLDGVGDLIVCLADDVVCEVRHPSYRSKGLMFSSEHEPRTFRFFPSQPHARSSLLPSDQDFLKAHEQLLGRTIADCLVSVAPDDVDLHDASPSLLESVLVGDGRVIATTTGSYGDNAMHRDTSLLWLDGESFRQLTGSEAVYKIATSSRQVTRTVPCNTISDSAFFMANCYGLDNRQTIPPFLPGHRGADVLMGEMLKRCFRSNLFGYLPTAVLQAPGETSTVNFGASDGNLTSDALSILIENLPWTDPRVSPATTLCHIGECLCGVAKLPPADLAELLRVQALSYFTARIWNAERWISERAVTAGGGFCQWVSDIRQVVDSLREFVRQPWFMIPSDMADGRSPEEALVLFGHVIGRFGELLCAWPELCHAARCLRKHGQRLAQSIP